MNIRSPFLLWVTAETLVSSADTQLGVSVAEAAAGGEPDGE